jgi:hypothetical protein
MHASCSVISPQIASISSHESNGSISPTRGAGFFTSAAGVLLDPLPPHRRLQHLPQRAMRRMPPILFARKDTPERSPIDHGSATRPWSLSIAP